jgi:alkylation response protein AidB-like acyl-CoA dehydrogenase
VSGIIRRHGGGQVAVAEVEPRQAGPARAGLLRKGETFAELAAGFGVGVTTAWRYVNETVALLAARAPRLRQAIRDATKNGHAYVILDGTHIPIDRGRRGPAVLHRGQQGAHTEIQAIKIVTPAMAQWVIDRAIQAHGGGGVSQDFPLAHLWASARTLRFADGPDEVHKRSLARREIRKATSSGTQGQTWWDQSL